MLDAWNGARVASDPTFRDDHVLIVGPLGHDIAGGHNFSTLEFARLAAAEVDALVVGAELSSEFFRWSKCTNEWALDNHCKCQEATGAKRKKLGRVNLFIMGDFGVEFPTGPGNYWTSLDDFPAANTVPMYLSDGSLTDDLATSTGSSQYVYDPTDPAPMNGGNNLPGIGSIANCASGDQTARESRSDVITFDSAPLAGDLRVVGSVSATVFLSSNVSDTDFFVTLSDLHPDKEKSMLVRYGIQRMRWRDSESVKSEPMSAGQVYEVTINLGYTGYIFTKGHHVRVSISSAADPYFVPTTNTGENDMITKVTPVVAENSVHFAPDQPSRVDLPVVTVDAIPKNSQFNPIPPFSDHIVV